MQDEVFLITHLYKEFSDGDNWTGINARDALKDVDAATAVKKMHEHHLNIAELLAHMTCWNITMANRLVGNDYRPAPDEDFPVIRELSKDEWERLKQGFFDSVLLLNDKLLNKNDRELTLPIFEGASSTYRNVHGQIGHLHYHLGQIVLLKKLFR